MQHLLLKILILCAVTGYFTMAQKTCVYNGAEYQVGESVTGDPCDKCTCTQFGLMCELIHCPTPRCVDSYIPEGECCQVCPTGTNCLHHGNLGPAIIPESGCMYSSLEECYCYYMSKNPTSGRTYCLPPLFQWYQWHAQLPDCNLTTV